MTCSVLVVGLPPVAGCDPGKTWRAAADFVGQRLAQRFGDLVSFECAELFSPDMDMCPDIEAHIAAGQAELPLVVIDGVPRISGGKLNLGAIERLVADTIEPASTRGHTSAIELTSDLGTASAPRARSAKLRAKPIDLTATTEGRVS